MNFAEIAHKKVLGVPLLYVGLIVVGILAVVAYKIKAVPAVSSDATDTTATDATSTDGTVTSSDLAGSVYDGLKTTGTVVVAPTPTDTDTTTTVDTNSTWVSKGATWLVANDKASGTDATAALSAYVQGMDYTYDQGTLINLWIAQDGPPPDGLDSVGKVGNKPAVRQITTLPGYHTVTGTGDNTYGDIALIYYGHNEQATYDLVQAANITKLGQSGPFSVGTKVYVPVYSQPVFYTVPTANMPSASIAAKNGISTDQLTALNNNGKATWPKSAKVRVK